MDQLLEFIDNHGIDKLMLPPYHITVKSYPGNLHILKYSQINGPKFDPIIRQCRGTIVNTSDPNKTVLVARSFERFFNLGEDPREVVPTTRIRFDEKLDGSLITVYFWKGKWNIATKGMAFAEGDLHCGISFKELFEQTIGMDIDDWMDGIPHDNITNKSFVFELTTLENKVVRAYPEGYVTLLAVFDCVQNIEHGSLIRSMYEEYLMKESTGIRKLKQYDGYLDDIHEAICGLEPTEEGYVLVFEDSEGKLRRVKIKNEQYVALHHAANGGIMTTKRILAILDQNEQAEFLQYFPEWTDKFTSVKGGIDCLRMLCDNYTKAMLWTLEGKEFAMVVKDLPMSPVLFKMKSSGKSFNEIWKTMRVSAKINLIEAMQCG